MEFKTPQFNKKTETEIKNDKNVEIKDVNEGMEKVSELISEIKKNMPSVKTLSEGYENSFSTDHYHAERGEEISILMMLRAQLEIISNRMRNASNVQQDNFGLSLKLPAVETIDNLINLLKSKTGSSRAKFLDADTFKIHDLMEELKRTVSSTKVLIEKNTI